MRVLHVIPQFPYFGAGTIVGGHASSLLTLARAQARGGHRVSVLSYTEGGDSSPREIEPNFEIASVFRHATPSGVCFGISFMRAARAWTAARRGEFDIVHAHSGFADYIPVSQMIGRRARIPTIHSMYCPVPRASGRWNTPIVRNVILNAAARLDGLTAISANVADSLRALGVARPDLRVVPPTVDTSRFTPGDAKSVREGLGIAPADPMVLFVGNTKAQKNLTGTLEAFASARRRHPSAKLVVTTELKRSSNEADRRALIERADSLGLGSSLIQLGIVRDMPALMRACDVLVAPFLDSFGPSDYFMAALEAMASGKPVIASAVGGMPEVITPENGRLVDPRETGAIATSLDELLGDPALRDRLGADARLTIERRFAPERVLHDCESLYAAVIESGE